MGRLVQRQTAALRDRPRPTQRTRIDVLRSTPAPRGGWSQPLKSPQNPGRFMHEDVDLASVCEMSAIMVMYTLGRPYVPALNDGDAVLLEHGQRVNHEYDWSGYCMLYTLMYLEERGLVFETVGEY